MHTCYIYQHIFVQAGHNGWKSEIKISDLEARLGASISADNIIQQEEMQFKKENDDQVYKEEDLPDFYDARIMFPHCTTIGSIKDQSVCGSCWVNILYILNKKDFKKSVKR